MATTFGALAGKLLTLRRQVSFEATQRLCSLNLLWGEGALPLWKDSASQRPDLSRQQVVDSSRGTERSGEEEPTQQGGRGGLITPLGGTRRSRDPQAGSNCLVHTSVFSDSG